MLHKKKFITFSILITISSLLSVFCTVNKPSPSSRVKAAFDLELQELQSVLQQQLVVSIQNKQETQIKYSFLLARTRFKRMEYYLEYFFPTTSVLLNGAPIDEIELGENLIENPTGFQVMEELIYEAETKENRAILLNEVQKMILNVKRVARFNEQYELTDAQIFDALRLEVFRIISLGITGFDTPAALQSLPEAAFALNGIKDVLVIYGADGKITNHIKQAEVVLRNAKTFNSFNRINFITNYLQPLSLHIDSLRKTLSIETVAGSSSLSDTATGLFQKDAFDVNRFVGNRTEFISPEKVALGKMLFNSTILSNNGNRSCNSCHFQSKAFTDGLKTASGIVIKNASGKSNTLLRNTPTLTYAGLQRGFFYDLKAGTLEDQALDVIHHKDEMDGSLADASTRINQSKKFTNLFTNAFGKNNASANPWKIQHALASYIRSLAPFSSKLDLYMRGDKTQLNETEKSGFNLFMGKGKCGSCHFAPLFNGTQAPLFIKSEAEVLGVPSRPDTSNATIDKDLGRFALSPYPQYKYAFKTTTLRNVGKTAPYMHNGVYETLEEVVDFYNRGGGAGIGIKVDNQTLSADPLDLNKQEIKDIVAFLKTLDDR